MTNQDLVMREQDQTIFRTIHLEYIKWKMMIKWHVYQIS